MNAWIYEPSPAFLRRRTNFVPLSYFEGYRRFSFIDDARRLFAQYGLTEQFSISEEDFVQGADWTPVMHQRTRAFVTHLLDHDISLHRWTVASVWSVLFAFENKADAVMARLFLDF